MRAIWLVAGLVAAMAVSGTALAVKPVPSGNVTLAFIGCSASIDGEWAATPGQARYYDVVLTNSETGGWYTFDTGTHARTGTTSTAYGLASGTTRTFTARIWFYDRQGAVILGYSSNSVVADCS